VWRSRIVPSVVGISRVIGELDSKNYLPVDFMAEVVVANDDAG
jgi:hypothetical protein